MADNLLFVPETCLIIRKPIRERLPVQLRRVEKQTHLEKPWLQWQNGNVGKQTRAFEDGGCEPSAQACATDTAKMQRKSTGRTIAKQCMDGSPKHLRHPRNNIPMKFIAPSLTKKKKTTKSY